MKPLLPVSGRAARRRLVQVLPIARRFGGGSLRVARAGPASVPSPALVAALASHLEAVPPACHAARVAGADQRTPHRPVVATRSWTLGTTSAPSRERSPH